MVNCNPETVSTDYDTSDRLFFEPLTGEDVLAIARRLQARGTLAGVVVALGGQTPLKLAHSLEAAGVPVLGTSPASIDLAEDRERFRSLCAGLGILQPLGATVTTAEEARAAAGEIGFPVLVRPSYVLGGRAMQIVYDIDALDQAMAELAFAGSLGREGGLSAERPVLVDRFLEDAVEVDVDAIRDATGEFLLGGVMEHIEQAGVHSGDSACAIPPQTLRGDVVARIVAHTRSLADALDVRGLLNVQYAVKDDEVFILEANPRASRTVPFVSKATGVQLAKVAARVMLGSTLESLREEGVLGEGTTGAHVAVKEAVLPFGRFPDVDTVLGPEMRSTGEVMGIDHSFGLAFAKSQAGAGNHLPTRGTVMFSLADRDKPIGMLAARKLAELGFSIVATSGTAAAFVADGIPVEAVVGKLGDDVGGSPQLDAVELLMSGRVDLVVNTPRGRGSRADGAHIRRTATVQKIACLTTVAAALRGRRRDRRSRWRGSRSCARSRNTTGTPSCAWTSGERGTAAQGPAPEPAARRARRPAADRPRGPSRPDHLAGSHRHRVGHVRPRRRSRPLRPGGTSGRGDGQVARGIGVGGQAGPPAAPRRLGDAQRRRPPGPRRARVGRT